MKKIKNIHKRPSNKDSISFLLDDIVKKDKIDTLQKTSLTKEIVGSLRLQTNKGVHVDINRVNNERYINKHFISINKGLNYGDYYIGFVETLEDWRKRRAWRRIPFIGGLLRVWDFGLLRIAPKIWGVKKIYFFLTGGRGRLISKAEVLGRLVSCGFEIHSIKPVDNKHYFVVKKVSHPKNKNKPSYGPMFKMQRVGKNGKIIGVYKLRTMHPYSEYLQEYMIKNHGYGSSGKIKDDFRMSKWAKIVRKYWLDELPQLINLFKGDMKLVGVRPVSPIYFNEIPKELQQLRLKYKPGCIPPYVAFNKSSKLESVLDAEMMYLEMKNKRPYTTDTILFFKAVFNIVFRGKRSA